ncbi:UNVERIFIED_CONTAM: hypothetical protein FKN15_066951 [Acipenser sinensis]
MKEVVKDVLEGENRLVYTYGVTNSGKTYTIQEDCSEKVKIYLRVRPFTDPEQGKGEDQGCVFIENSATLLLHAPKDSFTMKNTERGIGQSVHKFTFSQILGPETTQKEFFDATMKEVVKDVLEGENRLVYTYGVTNSGKTYTIQGTSRDGGILPRSLSVVFNSIQGKLYTGLDLKPSLCNEVIWLESKQVMQSAEGTRASSEDCSEKVKIYLRVRPFTDPEQGKGEDQGCVFIENSATLLLHAPKDSFTMKNTERGIGQSVHKFTFSQILGPETTQKQFFDATMKEVVKDVLEGENRLVYTYGVTNSGKTYTIQGTSRDGGILPRSLSVVFNSIQGKLYSGLDLKPSLCNEVIWLESKQVMQEEMKKSAFLREEEVLTPMKKSDSGSFRSRFGTSSFDSGIGFSAASQLNSQLHSQLEDSGSHCKDPDMVEIREEGCVQYSVWVSFFEIYNEFLYDLLDTVPSNQNRKRQTLKLCEDKYGNPYVKDLNWINVSSAEDAWKVLKVGRKNQSFASTNLNHCSSRSHSIFSIRILHINGDPESDLAPKISELSLCDLAGSERCKEQKSGDRMKEANNINTSLHTLGRCIAALRQNQQHKTKQNMVPFRDSKLTRAFQGFFCGRGKSCMIVNINQCASMYDETLQALKFSAIATQLVHAPPSKTRVAYIQSLLREHGMRTNDSLSEDEEEGQGEESDDEGDVTVFDTDVS